MKRYWVDLVIAITPFAVLIAFLVLGVVGWDRWLVNWPW